MPTKLKRYCVSFPDDLLKDVEAAAEHYHMPFSKMVLFLCVKGLDTKKDVPVFRSAEVASPPKKVANGR